jgi:ABC-type bacteriocin/lantibiotic exporter with double-glycine peptidase domain
MKIIEYPETRQVYNYDCGANALQSLLVFAGIEEREDRIAKLAGTTTEGTDTVGIHRVLNYYNLPYKAEEGMLLASLKRAIDDGYPVILPLQAYRETNELYAKLWDSGHWVVCIGYDGYRFIFEDPASFHRTWLASEELCHRWHDRDGRKSINRWGCVLLVKGVYNHARVDHMD